MYTALVIGAIFVIVLGVPATMWLTKLRVFRESSG